MLRRYVCAAVAVLALGGFVLADTITGLLTEIGEKEAKVTAFKKGEKGKKAKGEEKTFKVSKDVKIYKMKGKDDKESLKMDALKEMIANAKGKVKGVFITAEEKDGTLTEITVRGGGKGKKKKKDAE